ncbi:hypothetical protein GGR58DRAFT_518484 [Xylaria digitata]|nr:hypothetical protein GGR58DRAFT_518484 [Xylaria digitata]
MSDISVSEDHEWPFEVKPSEDKGLGAFATKDIKPGEIVLVDYTTIILKGAEDWAEQCQRMVEIYEALSLEEQEQWGSLAASSTERRMIRTKFQFSRRKPDGSKFSEAEQQKYTMLKLQLDCNCFDLRNNRAGLFLNASRFNHSCDPNLWYEADIKDGRWVARACRDIKKGEELFISYILINNPLEERRAAIAGWGFVCDCPKCSGGSDTYTASLEDARDAANGIEPDRNRPLPVFGNTMEEIGQRLHKQINLLREIYQKRGAADEDKSIHKELVFALMEGADYERVQWVTFSKAGNREEAENHLKPYVDFVYESRAIAETVWPMTHESK